MDAEITTLLQECDTLKNRLSAIRPLPAEALKKRVQGVVMVRFVVKKDGKIGEIKIIKSLDPDCDREVKRLIRKMPDWIPGRYEGKPVTSYFVLPIIFAL